MQLSDIIATQARYARCIDDDRLEEWPDFFLDPCVYRVTTAENLRLGYVAGLIWADSRGMLQDRVAALREANIYERHAYRHLLGLPLLEPPTPAGLRSETPFMVARIMRDGVTSLFATGRYLDLWRAGSAGLPMLAERIVVCDSARIDTLLAIPL
jgi:anthranilate 1,2-dioxygenase small subunit